MKMINRCLFTYGAIYPVKKEKIIEIFLENNENIDKVQIIQDKPLPFVNGELAPASYFYSLFTIEELSSDVFKPKIFLVIDKDLDSKEIKLGNNVMIKLMYITV